MEAGELYVFVIGAMQWPVKILVELYIFSCYVVFVVSFLVF